jgi:hypothetical protein
MHKANDSTLVRLRDPEHYLKTSEVLWHLAPASSRDSTGFLKRRGLRRNVGCYCLKRATSSFSAAANAFITASLLSNDAPMPLAVTTCDE